MPTFKKARGYVQKNNPFKMHKSPATMTGSPLHQAKGDDSLMEDFVPAFEGADISEKEYKNRIYVSNSNKAGSYVSEDELESKFKKKGDDPKDYPQLSVQDYSKVKVDKDGRKYVSPRVD